MTVKTLFDCFASLRLTVWLLLASLLLVFFGTLDQVELGVRGAQIKYFENVFTTWGYPATWPLGTWLHVVYLPIAGGYLLGPLLVLNLACAHFRHFRPRWSIGGIALIHLGILLLIFSQLTTQLIQRESYIWFEEGQSTSHLTSFDQDELVLIDTTEADADTVHSIPAEALRQSTLITLAGLPFQINPVDYYENATILQNVNGAALHTRADRGLAVKRSLSAHPTPASFKANERNATTAYVSLQDGDQQIGTWLVSNLFEESMPHQEFEYQGRHYRIALRYARQPLPYSLHLLDFSHDRYPGTNIPHNFSSHIQLRHRLSGESREVVIKMNHPLRYQGLTFYQSAFGKDALGREDRASRLQVVSNPGWLGPYIACALISIGMLWQFGWGLLKFGRRRKAIAHAPASSPTAAAAPTGTAAARYLALTLCVALSLGALALLSKPLTAPATPAAAADAFDLARLGQLAVLDGGRLKPLDTLARNTLILTRSKQTALDSQGQPVPAIEFLARLFFEPAAAAEYPIFRLDNPDLLDLVGQPNDQTTHLSYSQLRPYLKTIDTQNKLVPEQAAERSPYHHALIKLFRSVLRYQNLEKGILPQIPAGLNQSAFLDSVLSPPSEQPHSSPAMAALLQQQVNGPGLLLIPTLATPSQPGAAPEWISPSAAILNASLSGQADPMLAAYLQLTDAWTAGEPATFNQALAALLQSTQRRMDAGLSRTRLEFAFNHIQPFYLSLQLYLLAFIATALFWLLGQASLVRVGVAIAAVSLLIHSFGLLARIYISGYAPVTNLYSSSVFIGWIAVLLAMPFERIFRNGLVTAAACLTGFTTLIIAHNIAVSGGADTMEMMRAVLDSNFWLSTHVTTVTIGYSTTFLAGALGILYVLLHFSARGPDAATLAALKRMVYGMICFSLLFSFVGTILGGIWADQSWGRFWGWDPKENGALMIVLWNALILHGIRTTLFGTRGLMLLAIGGNIITSWSWFGTNMLGVGLHSYGFMNQAFLWLMAFWISQLACIAVGAILTRARRSQLVEA